MARVCMVVFNFYAFDARARREAEGKKSCQGLSI